MNKRVGMLVEPEFEDLEFSVVYMRLQEEGAESGKRVDEPAFQDGNLVWGRAAADIPHCCRVLVQALEDS